jgi:hypothetical protein
VSSSMFQTLKKMLYSYECNKIRPIKKIKIMTDSVLSVENIIIRCLNLILIKYIIANKIKYNHDLHFAEHVIYSSGTTVLIVLM